MTRLSDAEIEGCVGCGYWHGYEGRPLDGECRRHAPVIVNEGATTFHGWPRTFASGWCGEWEAA